MGYTMLDNQKKYYDEYSLEGAVLKFIRDYCEKLRFDSKKANESETKKYTGTSLKENQIPYNMQMDIDRLCFENVLKRFLESGKKEDAFDIYFCYLEMFIGDYDKTRRMIELLSEFEANGSGLLMKHRDHYSHSVYVFALGLAIYATNSIYRDEYKKYYKLTDEHEAAYHYLQYWGLASLFHDIGYPFELPFEQVESYFEVNKEKRKDNPYIAYCELDSFVTIDAELVEELSKIYDGKIFETTNDLFAYVISKKLSKEYGKSYNFTEKQMVEWLKEKPSYPNKFGYFMDHGYFSATLLFKKLFGEMKVKPNAEYVDALTAILMHNSLYKFCIAGNYKKSKNPLKVEQHPLAFMLMLCDELQCWDRTAYGRNSKLQVHPMECDFNFENNTISATYLFDEKEITKINRYKDQYIDMLKLDPEPFDKNSEEHKAWEKRKPELKAYSAMYEVDENGVSDFRRDIECIIDLTKIKLFVSTGLSANSRLKKTGYLSNSNFINLYNFAVVLNGRWYSPEWKKAKERGHEEEFIFNEEYKESFEKNFKALSLEYKLSNINQAKSFARYLNKIDCFFTDKDVDFEMVEKFTDEELVKIGPLEHKRWLQEHYDMGWKFGNPADKNERELLRIHNDMIPEFNQNQLYVSYEEAKKNYDRLGKAEQDKDTEPMECMLAMLKMFDGLRIYRLK